MRFCDQCIGIPGGLGGTDVIFSYGFSDTGGMFLIVASTSGSIFSLGIVPSSARKLTDGML